MGGWWLAILVVVLSPYNSTPPQQMWGPFLTQERCETALGAVDPVPSDPLSDDSWGLEEGVCLPSAVPPAEMTVRRMDHAVLD